MATPTPPFANMAPLPSTNTNSTSNIISSHPEIPSTSSQLSQLSLNNNNSRITNVKFLNATSYVLQTLMIGGVIFLGVREEGIWGDDFLWMKYQTLLTPPNYVNYIWIPIFLLQGLFIYASTYHKTLQSSPLVGYQYDSKKSVAVHYPAVCAATLMMVYAHDYGYIFMAFLSSVLGAVIVGRVWKIQGELLDEMEEAEGNNNNTTSNMDESGIGYVKEEEGENEVHNNMMDSIKARAIQFFAFRLPFELLGGYVLALMALYLNTFLHGFESLSSMVYLVVANASLVGLMFMGFLILWKIPGRKFYGAGVSLVWYLLGVAIELHTPTQPIYNEFSDNAILTTQIVATVATTILMTLLGVRVNKTMIKYNVFNCVGRFGGGDNDSVVSDDRDDIGISAGYVHA